MADELVIVPSDGDGYVSLAKTRTGRLFRKHLLNLGPLRHPATGETITVDKKFVDTMKRNFDDGVCDIVQVPLANAKNEHSEDPTRNIGEVVDIELNGDKVYAVLDIRDPAHADRLGKTYLGASAMLSLDYTNTKTGQKVGPTLLHSCVTNRPYVTGLENYQELIAATSDSSQGSVLLSTDVVEVAPETTTGANAVTRETNASEETDMPEENKPAQETKPSLEELLSALKTDHNIDVTGLQLKAKEGEQAATLTAALTKALTETGLVQLSNGDTAESVSTETLVGAVAEIADKNVSLTDRVNKLERQDAEHAVQTLIEAGRVLPAQKDAFVDLKLSNAAMFDALIPAEPIVKLAREVGVAPPKADAHTKDIDGEVARLVKLHAERAARK